MRSFHTTLITRARALKHTHIHQPHCDGQEHGIRWKLQQFRRLHALQADRRRRRRCQTTTQYTHSSCFISLAGYPFQDPSERSQGLTFVIATCHHHRLLLCHSSPSIYLIRLQLINNNKSPSVHFYSIRSYVRSPSHAQMRCPLSQTTLNSHLSTKELNLNTKKKKYKNNEWIETLAFPQKPNFQPCHREELTTKYYLDVHTTRTQSQTNSLVPG